MPQYKVQAGDTLSQIASQHQVSVYAIQSRNPIVQNPNHIESGWLLEIPTTSTKAKAPLSPPLSTNDASTGDSVCSPCQLEYVDLLHVTGEGDTVYALTQSQAEEIEKEIQSLQKPMEKLRSAEGEDPNQLKAVKEDVWGELKNLNALPPVNVSTSVQESMADYEAQWQRAERRLAHQKNRKERIEAEITEVRRLGLLPLLRQPSNNPRDQLTINFFQALAKELEETLPDIKHTLAAHQRAAANSRKDVTTLKDSLKLLRAALEAEITSLVAQAEKWDASQLQQLAYETGEFKKTTQWPNYIPQPEIDTLVRRQIRLNEIEAEPEPSLWEKVADYIASSNPTPTLWSLIETENLEKYRKLQEEREDLLSMQEDHINRLVQTSPPPTVDVFAKPQTGSVQKWQLVEIKRSGSAGYRYVHRDLLNQLRTRWRPISMNDIKASMDTGEFKRAAGDALDGLKKNRSLKTKLAEWKSSKDNFFNQLNIEVFEAKTSTQDGRFAADAEAQMFRFASQAGLEAGYDRAASIAYIGGKADIAYSLLEGQASLKAQLPDAEGFHLRLSYEDRKGALVKLDCGRIRADAEYKIQGFAGACASLAANAKVSTAPGEVGLTGETGGEAFAGASVSNEASFGVKWKATYQHVISEKGGDQAGESQQAADADFKPLLEVKPEFAISAGIGAGFDFKVELVDDRLYLSLKGHVVLGPGGGGGVAAELNGSQIWELIKFLRWSLEQSDFRFLEWVDEAAFEYVTWLLKAHVVVASSIPDLAARGLEAIQLIWASSTANYPAILNSASNVLGNKSLDTLTPAAKAQLLTTFSQHVEGDVEPIAAAAMAIVKTIRSHREFIEVLKRMGEGDPSKGKFSDLKRHYGRLLYKFLYNSTQSKSAENWLASLYRGA